MSRIFSMSLLTAFTAAFAIFSVAAAAETHVYIGTFTRGGDSQGIYQFRLDLDSGTLAPVNDVVETSNPAFLAIASSGRYLYAVSEVADFEGKRSGAVAAFRIDPASKDLAFINHAASKGAGPCHLVVDHTDRNVLVANYGGGSVAVLPIREDGGLREASSFVQHTGSSLNPRRQTAPHAHSINVSPDNRFAFVADLGLDQVLSYRFDAAEGMLTPNDPPFVKTAPGAGPRHFAFHPSGKFAYVINELDSTLLPFRYDAESGRLTPQQAVSTLPDDFEGNNSTAEVRVHPNGKFVYGSNRGHDSIAVFRVGREGELERVENVPTQGQTPRNFNIDPSGAYLIAANQATNNLAVFRIDGDSGRLSLIGSPIDCPTPVCVRFLPLE